MKNKDILSILHVDTKEDYYTFCLEEFLNDSKEYRTKAASAWGFEDGNYQVKRTSISIDPSKSKAGESSKHRTKIIPDLILYNANHIALVESKMFASEGSDQTYDYEKAEQEIIRETNCPNAKVEYYYFTLAGIAAASSRFQTKRWSDYYNATLSDNRFENESLEIIKKSILDRATEFKAFELNYKNMSYSDLTENKNCWIGPFALFSSGMLNAEWGFDPEKYHIYNGKITGRGHVTYRTDISPKKYNWLKGEQEDDSIYLFSRIEWNENTVDVFLNYEYWKNDGSDYVPFSHLDKKHQKISIENRHNMIQYLKQADLSDYMTIPSEKNNMLHMLKASVCGTDRNIADVVKEIKQVLQCYNQLISIMYSRFEMDGGYYRFR